MKYADIIKNLTRPAPGTVPGSVLPTGSPSLDILLGGGWPAGVISEVCGSYPHMVRVAYRAIGAAQAACPLSPVIFCPAINDYSHWLGDLFGVDPGRLLVTRSLDVATGPTVLDPAPRLAVIDLTLGGGSGPVRDDKDLTVLYLTTRPGEVRSTACISLNSYRGAHDWAWADRMWHSWFPGIVPYDQHLICLTRQAAVQEILDIAVTLGIITVRGHWYSHGRLQIGSSWEEAVFELTDQPGLKAQILAEAAARLPVHPGWESLYS